MKLSIIFGVLHMIFGVCMSVVNFIHFRKAESILLEFVPQIVFLISLFLWMVVMMFLKWIIYGPNDERDDLTTVGTSCAPSVLIFFINMMLFKSQDPPKNCNMFMFPGQDKLQKVLVFVALICVPIMLLGKPLYIMTTRRAHRGRRGVMVTVVNTNGDVTQGMELQPSMSDDEMQPIHVNSEDEHEEPMSEIFIHQAIHTIEYVLSTISHTASYLRLWALSLAHAQLSEVLWNMVLQMGLTQTSYVGVVMLYIVFGVWAVFTLSILVMMEGLSAFLHTLRLHWVEFMSKFYSGLGSPFQPFTFKNIMDDADEKSDD